MMWIGGTIIGMVGLGGIFVMYGEFRKKRLKKTDVICGSSIVVAIMIIGPLLYWLTRIT